MITKKYRKKPITIEAFLFGFDSVPDWFMDAVSRNDVIMHSNSKHPLPKTASDYCVIKTLKGGMIASFGDYIIQGVTGEIYPCKPDIFIKTYDEVTD